METQRAKAQVSDHIKVLSLVVQLCAISNRSADDIIAEANERKRKIGP